MSAITFVIVFLGIPFIISIVSLVLLKKFGNTGIGTSLFLSSGIFIVLALILFFSLKPWAFVDNYELGYIYDARDGQIKVLSHTGYTARVPFFESVHTVDLRPRQVCINVGSVNGTGSSGANSRVLNCKLVRFNPKGLLTFLSWHGRGDYSGDTLDDLLKIYAYDGSGRTYPFLDVLRELKNADTPPQIPTPVGPAKVAS